jgi:hypothetical protein
MLTTAMNIHSVQSKTQIKKTQGMEKGKKIKWESKPQLLSMLPNRMQKSSSFSVPSE